MEAMQRRYRVCLAVVLVALVAIPGLALAAGLSHGFGPNAAPPHQGCEEKNGTPAWAGNETAFRANASKMVPGWSCNGSCIANQTRTREGLRIRNITHPEDHVCGGEQLRTRTWDHARLNPGVVNGTPQQSVLPGRHLRTRTG